MSEVEMEQESSPAPEEVKPIAGIGTLVFGKWDASQVTCKDPGLAPYINLTTVGVPHTGGRHANAWFGKAKLSVVERYINKLMRTGPYTGKKQGAMKAFETALDNIAEKSGETLYKHSSTLYVTALRWKKSLESSLAQFLSPKLWIHHHLED